ncbi:MAG: sigma-70 family RNA polymerase sigma factor [Candidatus Hydrogenedentes bacterium]|nr:sigma-70 family RNA polymerase sigma factor [Candidatus Hydrogenedentota bacterium]
MAKTSVKQDRRQEFEEVALVHLDSLYNGALRMTRNPTDAEDLVQDTVLKAFRFFDKFHRGTNIRAWLFTILTNTYINRYRKRARQPSMVEFEEGRVAGVPNTPFVPPTGGPETERVEMLLELVDDDIKSALDSLPDDFRIVVLLADLENFSYKEIAEIVGCPLGTVMSRLYRGRRLLRKKLHDYARNKGYFRGEETWTAKE